ncbi:L-lactate permease [Brevibacterium litoralis]|uniref:L-lactate permease n=1 Tax=Brevibacterium litoralis TaxID=3138935 RepID=UPI0032EE0F86
MFIDQVVPGLIALVPVFVAVACILLRISPIVSAGLGVLSALTVGILVFPEPLVVWGTGVLLQSPLWVEVVLIMLGGLLLARVQEASGYMRTLSAWLLRSVPGPTAGAALVVWGIVPFAETVTGYGVGVTIGIPILVHLGFRPLRAAFLGVLGMVMAPWGSMGPGTRIAAGLGRVDLKEIGIEGAWINAAAILVTVVVATYTLRFHRRDHTEKIILWNSLGGVCLWAGILVANVLVGTPVAGVLGGLFVIGVMFLVFRLQRNDVHMSRRVVLAMTPYLALLLGSVTASLLADILLTAFGPALTTVLTSPALWLVVGGLTSLFVSSRRWGGQQPEPWDVGSTMLTVVRAWVPAATATLGFLFLGFVLTTTDMAAAIGGLLTLTGPIGFLWAGGLLSVLGGVVTASGTGTNAMFASTFGLGADTLDMDRTLVMASMNGVGAIGSNASVGRALLASQVAGATRKQRGTLLFYLLAWVAGVYLAMLGLVSLILVAG